MDFGHRHFLPGEIPLVQFPRRFHDDQTAHFDFVGDLAKFD